jgi:5-methylcytosine-specific restriction enzyme subunit McrC
MIVLNEHYGYPNPKPISEDLSDYDVILNNLSVKKYFKQKGNNHLCFALTYNQLSDEKYFFETSYFIGVDWIVENKLSVYVQPKLNIENTEIDYLSMLFDALKEKENYNHLKYLYKIDFKKPLIKINQKQDLLSPILVIQYLNLIKGIVQKGLKKSYYQKVSNFNSKVKGKILIKDTIRRNHFRGDYVSTYCKYNEFGYNSTENKILKKALVFSQKIIKNLKGIGNSNLQEILNYINPAFDKVDNTVEIHELKYYKPNPLYKEYEQALAIAKLIFKRYGYNIQKIGESKMETPPFWLDMSKLFELYIYKKLRTLFPLRNEVIYHKTYNYLEPDFILNSKDGNYKMVVDAKYKPHYHTNNISKDDIRQVSGYARLEPIYKELKIDDCNNVIDCLIIYSNQLDDNKELNIDDLKKIKIPHYVKFYKTGIKLPTLIGE